MVLNKSHEGIRAEMIIEVLGKPAEHLTETLNKIAEEIGKEHGIKLTKKKINEPMPLNEQPEYFTNFAEIEVEVDDVLYIAILMFKYMPSHIEIISPEVVALTNSGWNDILNELTRRLHGYDEIARVLGVEKSILEKRLREEIAKNSGESPAEKSPEIKKDSKKKRK